MILLSGISQMHIANHYYLKWIFILEILEYNYNYIDSRHKNGCSFHSKAATGKWRLMAKKMEKKAKKSLYLYDSQ